MLTHSRGQLQQIRKLGCIMMLLFLFCLAEASSEIIADIYKCSENDTRVLHFAEHTDFEICCHLDESYCTNYSLNDSLTLLPIDDGACSESCIASRMQRVDACLVKLMFKNASSADEGVYLCKLNTQNLTRHTLHFIEKPESPVIKSFTYESTRLTVTFDRGVPSTKYNDSYIVNMTEMNEETNLCNKNDVVCKNNETICTCKSINFVQLESNNITITVRVIRSLQFSETRKIFSVAANILPGPVKHLALISISTFDAFIVFCMHKNSQDLYRFMFNAGVPLLYHLSVLRTQGDPEILNVTLQSVINNDTSVINRCVLVHLQNLMAFTNYILVVSNSGGGGESPKIKLQFTTNQTEPLQAPEVDNFSYSRFKNFTVIFWKPLPHAAQRGNNLFYTFEIILEDKTNITNHTMETFAIMNMTLPSGQLTAKIWSQNDVGRSNETTLLVISPKQELLPSVYVEVNGDGADVYVNLTNLKKDVNLTIHWCRNYSDIVCQEYPQTSTVTIKRNVTHHQVFSMSTIDPKPFQEKTVYRMIEYHLLTFLDNQPRVTNLASASVTTFQNWVPPINEDYNYYSGNNNEVDKDASYYYDPENFSRKKREASNNIMNWFDMDEEQRRHLLPALNTDSGGSHKSPIFFMSMQMEDTFENTGMVPVRCIFDKSIDTVSLAVKYDFKNSDKKATLQINQNCDSNRPQQFLANYFNVFSSHNYYCQKDDKGLTFLKKITNRVLLPNFVDLPEETTTVCIQACKDDDDCYFDPTTHSITYPQETKVLAITEIIVGIVVFVLIIGFILLVYYCRRKKINIDKEFSGTNVLRGDNANGGNTVDPEVGDHPPEVPVRTPSVHQNSNNSADSGRGTGKDDSNHEILKKGSSNQILNTESFQKNPLDAASANQATGLSSSRVPDASNTGSEKCTRIPTAEGREENTDSNSDPDIDQAKVLERLGLTKKKNNTGSTESDSSATYSGTTECTTTTGSMYSSDHSGDSSRSKRSDLPCMKIIDEIPSVNKSNPSNLQRSPSSESESDGDQEKALLPPLIKILE